MSHARFYTPPRLTDYGDVVALTGFTGSATEQDTVFTPNGTFGFSGPASEFACQIKKPNDTQCLPDGRGSR